jgi:hypothetical protein
MFSFQMRKGYSVSATVKVKEIEKLKWSETKSECRLANAFHSHGKDKPLGEFNETFSMVD